MPPAAPAQAIDSRTRSRILAAATNRFAAFGYRRTGMAEIARQAGVAAGTLYRYFDSKEEIFRAVIRDLHDGWLARARRTPPDDHGEAPEPPEGLDEEIEFGIDEEGEEAEEEEGFP